MAFEALLKEYEARRAKALRQHAAIYTLEMEPDGDAPRVDERHTQTLASALARLELGREIPRELYVAVAHVLAFAWAVTGKR